MGSAISALDIVVGINTSQGKMPFFPSSFSLGRGGGILRAALHAAFSLFALIKEKREIGNYSRFSPIKKENTYLHYTYIYTWAMIGSNTSTVCRCSTKNNWITPSFPVRTDKCWGMISFYRVKWNKKNYTIGVWMCLGTGNPHEVSHQGATLQVSRLRQGIHHQGRSSKRGGECICALIPPKCISIFIL